jgi:transposase
VKFAGLDPKAFDSGKSVHKKTRISKAGNRYIRAALYMPALSAHQHAPHVRAYFQHWVVNNGKEKMQALCAVMRKLLHAIHGMLKHDKPFDKTRFMQFRHLSDRQKINKMELALKSIYPANAHQNAHQ